MERVDLQDRDLLWTNRLNLHGPLSTSYLLKYHQQSIHGAKMRLLDLTRGGYVYRPVREHKPFVPSVKDGEVYACTEAADDMLLGKRLTHRRSQLLNRFNFHHELFLSSTTASIELACVERGLEFIAEKELILKAPSGSRAFPCTIHHTANIWNKKMRGWEEVPQTATGSLVSDAYFGIKSSTGYRVFFLEVDCGTESVYKTNLSEESWRSKLLKYIQLMEEYKVHFGVKCAALVLLVFSERSKMDAVQQLLLDLTDNKGKNCFLFKLWQDFDKPWFIPKNVNHDLLKSPWYVVGTKDGQPRPPMYI